MVKKKKGKRSVKVTDGSFEQRELLPDDRYLKAKVLSIIASERPDPFSETHELQTRLKVTLALVDFEDDFGEGSRRTWGFINWKDSWFESGINKKSNLFDWFTKIMKIDTIEEIDVDIRRDAQGKIDALHEECLPELIGKTCRVLLKTVTMEDNQVQFVDKIRAAIDDDEEDDEEVEDSEEEDEEVEDEEEAGTLEEMFEEFFKEYDDFDPDAFETWEEAWADFNGQYNMPADTHEDIIEYLSDNEIDYDMDEEDAVEDEDEETEEDDEEDDGEEDETEEEEAEGEDEEDGEDEDGTPDCFGEFDAKDKTCKGCSLKKTCKEEEAEEEAEEVVEPKTKDDYISSILAQAQELDEPKDFYKSHKIKAKDISAAKVPLSKLKKIWKDLQSKLEGDGLDFLD